MSVVASLECQELDHQNLLERAGVYVIAHPDGVYVGASKCIFRRRNKHMTMLRTGKHPCKPLQEAYNRNPEVTIEVLVTNPEDIFESETAILKQYRDSGMNVFNRGGDDSRVPARGLKFSSEVRERLRISHLGIRHTEERKAKISSSMTRYMQSPEARQRVAETSRGRLHSEETRRRLSDMAKGRTLDQATIEKIRATKLAGSRAVLINGIRYAGVWEASKVLNLPCKRIRNRINSTTEQFKEWQWV